VRWSLYGRAKVDAIAKKWEGAPQKSDQRAKTHGKACYAGCSLTWQLFHSPVLDNLQHHPDNLVPGIITGTCNRNNISA